MTDWLTYKGQNPWTCIAPVDIIEYNEGSKITKSPRVSGGTPVWAVGETGPAITDTHAPCGYWFKDYEVNSCDCLDTIEYTSLQMSTGQQQTLTASGGQSDECYSWKITSGGGSLSAATGKSVVYTAPTTNPNCTNNPTISLTCGRAVVDTLQIAVNQVTGSYAAYQINGECEQGCRQLWSGMCEYYYQYAQTKYTCSGNVYSGPSVVGIKAFSTGCNDTNYPKCTNLKVACDKSGTCVQAGGCCNTFTVGTTDLRTAAQKTAGCCPAQLL
jgi:hypothetical protein